MNSLGSALLGISRLGKAKKPSEAATLGVATAAKPPGPASTMYAKGWGMIPGKYKGSPTRPHGSAWSSSNAAPGAARFGPQAADDFDIIGDEEIDLLKTLQSGRGAGGGKLPPPPPPKGGGISGEGIAKGFRKFTPYAKPWMLAPAMLGAGIWGLNKLGGGDDDEVNPLDNLPYFEGSEIPTDGSLSVSGSAGGDAYDKAQADLTEFYNQLLDQSAQDTARREQVMQDVYAEQKRYLGDLNAQSGTQNELMQAQRDQFEQDMMNDYAAMSQGGMAAGKGVSQQGRDNIMQRAFSDAATDRAYTADVGGSLDDLLLQSGAIAASQHGEDVSGLHAQAAEDQRSLRNQMMESASKYAFDNAGMQQRAELENASKLAQGYVIPPADRPAAYAEALKFFGEGSSIVDLPPQIQHAFQQFMVTGQADALNHAIRIFQTLPPDWPDFMPER